MEQDTATSSSGSLGSEEARTERILDDAGAEALVRHVDVGREAATLHEGEHIAPLLLGKIRAGRVVTGGVQQDQRALRQLVQVVHHAAEVDAAGLAVVVRVALELDARAREQRNVVGPRRRADVDGGVRVSPADQLRPTRRAPQPPGAWIVRMRLAFRVGWSAPNTSFSMAWLKPALPAGAT